MASALLIVVAVVMSLVLLAVAIYLLILYIHPDDKGWGTAWYCKVLVVMGLVLCWAQALIVPLDVANNHGYINSGGLDIKTLWYIVYISTLVMITCLLPYAIFFYQTDPDKNIVNRLLTSLMFTLIALVLVCILLFVSWVFLKYVDLPVESIVYTSTTYPANSPAQIVDFPHSVSETTIRLNASLPVYIMAILSFFGWIFLILFGGVGMFGLPLDLMREFRRRPRMRRTNQMRQQKDALTSAIVNHMKACVQVKEQEQAFHKAEYSFFQKIKKKRQLDAKISKFKAKYQLVEEEYQIFRVELSFQESNPFIPWLKLFLGIIFFITAVLWFIQLIFGLIAKKNGRPLIPFINQLFIYMDNHNAGFVATFLYAYFILYLVWTVQKGNIKFSQILPSCCKFHPMIPNGTWMNSFLFNIILLLIAVAGVTQLAASCFPTYIRNTVIYTVFGIQINFMHFYKVFYTNNIFPIAFVVWIFISFVVQLYFFIRPPKFIREKQAIRANDIEMNQKE